MISTNEQHGVQDPRSKRTCLALRRALSEEIQATGDLSRVTVKNLSVRAGVTRRTFYSHFRDISDLVDTIENETIADLELLVARLVQVDLNQMESAINTCGACPHTKDLLQYLKERKDYLGALLGEGGDPSFVKKLERMARRAVSVRAQKGLDLLMLGTFFDYYLTYVISAEVGVCVRWIVRGAQEDSDMMARIMTALMFVRPGDLYGRPIEVDVFSFGAKLLERLSAQKTNEKS